MTSIVPARRSEEVASRGQYATTGTFEPSPDQERPKTGAALGRIVAAIRRYKWLVVGFSVIGTGGSVVATRFIEPEYVTSASIYIQTGQGSRGPIRAEDLMGANSWISLLRSFAVVDPVVTQAKLFIESEKADSLVFADFGLDERFAFGRFKFKIDAQGRRYSLENRRGGPIESGNVGDSIGIKLGFKWAPAASALGKGREITFTVHSPRDASAAILNNLSTAMPDLKGDFLTLALRGSDAELITATLNGLIEQFVSVAAELKKEKLVRLTKDLKDQLQLADSSVRTSEGGLEAFRVRTITEPKDDVPVASGLAQTQATVYGGYLGLRQQLEALEIDRRAIEEVVRETLTQSPIPIDAYYTIATVKGAPELIGILRDAEKTQGELRALRLRYTDEYKGVKDLADEAEQLRIVTLPQAAARLIEQLRRREEVLRTQIEAQGQEMRQIPIRSMTESRLQRDAAANVTIYGMLQSRYEEAKLAELSATPDVRILDRAKLPTTPTSNTAPSIILMGVAVSLGLGLALAIGLDRLDKRFRYPEQVVDDLGLSILGVVPAIRRETGGVMGPEAALQVVESFRGIRLNIAHSFSGPECIATTVSSPSPGDGKSLISSNLALSFSEAGYKTVVIDGDIRRGELYRMFGTPRQPGLVDYLEGAASVSMIITPTSHANLSIIAAGRRNPRGPELLGSARMGELIAALKAEYGAIIIDSPPFQAGIDPLVLGAAVGSMLVVLRAGVTDRQLAEAKLQSLDRLPIRQLGAVLNHIEVGIGPYRYYAYEYGYGNNAPEGVDVDEQQLLGTHSDRASAATRP